MRKILGWALGLVIVVLAVTVHAASAAKSEDPGQWLVQVEGGANIPISSQAASQLCVGWGAEGQVGYAFSRAFFLSVESGFNNLPVQSARLSSGVSESVNHVPLEAVGQFNLDTGSGVWPYILVGVGVAFDSTNFTGYAPPSGTTTSWTNFELDPGLGVAFDLSKNINVFVQGKLAMDFETTTGSSQEFSDSPLILIPVQAGVNFLF